MARQRAAKRTTSATDDVMDENAKPRAQKGLTHRAPRRKAAKKDIAKADGVEEEVEESTEQLQPTHDELAVVFDMAQRSRANHARAIKRTEAFASAHSDTFAFLFAQKIRPILLVKKKEPSVERLIQFIVQICVTTEAKAVYQGNEMDFCMWFLSFCLSLHNAKDEAVRFRVCQLIAGIIDALPEDAEFMDEVWDNILENMLKRTRDRFARTRSQAVRALYRMQQPREKKCRVIRAYLRLLTLDGTAQVRKDVLEQISISKHTIQAVIERSRDLHPDVRRKTYEVINARVDVTSLKIAQRLQLLKGSANFGLRDRDASVREACVRMLCGSWLKSVDNDVVKLLSLLDGEGDEETTTLAGKEALKELFAAPSSASTGMLRDHFANSIDRDDLSLETALYWRLLCEHFQDFDDLLDEIRPTPYDYCQIINKYRVGEELSLIAKQVLKLGFLVDLSDEAGRIQLKDMLSEALTSPDTAVDLVGEAISLLSITCVGDEFVSQCLRIIDAVKRPVEMLSPDHELYQCLEEYACLRSLNLIDEVLAKAHSAVTHEGVRSEAERLLSTGLHHDSDRVRNAALRVQGLLCLLDKSELSRAVPIFSSILQSPESDMKATLVQVLFDLIMLYGMKEIADRVEDDLKSIFLSLLEDEDEVLRTVTAEGFAKLLFNDALDDHSAAFQALVILFHNPLTEEDYALRQCLHVFFKGYSYMGRRKNIDTIEKSLLPILSSIAQAPKRSPLHSITLDNVAKFLQDLARTSEVRYEANAAETAKKASTEEEKEQEQGENREMGTEEGEETMLKTTLQERLALQTCEEILEFPGEKESKVLCKMLNRFTLSGNDGPLLQRLGDLCGRLMEEVVDTQSFQQIKKFQQTVRAALEEWKERTAEEEEEAEQIGDGDNSADDGEETAKTDEDNEVILESDDEILLESDNDE